MSSPLSERYRRLGEFLRLKREGLLPADVGLPSSGRRRAQGLRREEVASIANVGVSWYTWLEQGRAAGASLEVLDAVARALRLNADEHRYVLGLARGDSGARVIAPSPADHARYGELVKTITTPAYVVDPCWRVIAANALAKECFDVDAGTNKLEQFFLDDAFAGRFVNPDMIGRSLVEQFRAQWARYPDDSIFDTLAQRFSTRSALFRKHWDGHAVGESYRGDVSFTHATLGLLTFEALILTLDGEAQLRLCTYLPRHQDRMSSAGAAHEAT
ncbi:helix-turn-helix domain-containing protein [Sinomonas gamaensis]|uniref:helix-turn-helix domain-containing protein n=1 Tax=Sinomonas gamaensis TaxID=2565624 RepID=UPI0014872749|nr:helix-turn-helix transcriptional regulator [Sinomonas gamaensis]